MIRSRCSAPGSKSPSSKVRHNRWPPDADVVSKPWMPWSKERWSLTNMVKPHQQHVVWQITPGRNAVLHNQLRFYHKQKRCFNNMWVSTATMWIQATQGPQRQHEIWVGLVYLCMSTLSYPIMLGTSIWTQPLTTGRFTPESSQSTRASVCHLCWTAVALKSQVKGEVVGSCAQTARSVQDGTAPRNPENSPAVEIVLWLLDQIPSGELT